MTLFFLHAHTNTSGVHTLVTSHPWPRDPEGLSLGRLLPLIALGPDPILSSGLRKVIAYILFSLALTPSPMWTTTWPLERTGRSKVSVQREDKGGQVAWEAKTQGRGHHGGLLLGAEPRPGLV